ncbi:MULTISPECIES: ribosomal protection-like ABC-F family protein [Selenomonas]|uniref:ABC-F family ATP-binding cassette domain-containing protein n=1 Tax=Selenomonas ruminis TaxID=2593411 RepID=A0A5D6W8P9_9FIRM|nr:MULTISPECIES: ABC-F family ATP-binding cassette domain-containing protein [unclassified Selenomonas]MBQ1868443.1 ABC-F family ATP-binding cassette domain-containing protein [Selenomonas sp.]TYZ23329.1 ABC-F family ATP-binding cassette domain-containing protein [Selenomonas sp. mPRGC5]
MGILKVNGLAKAFGIEELFHDVNFEVRRGERVGFVGANGAGKSTLMKILMGQVEADGGQIQFDSADTIGYVEQQSDFGEGTLYDEFRRAFDDIIELGERKRALEKKIAVDHDEETMAAYSKVVEQFERLEGYDYESRIRRVAFGLGFTEEDFAKDVQHFSGGQKTRICLVKALLREPDFLFLDEPTNHLDIHMIEWLEGFLKSYNGGVLLISHDRYFLDKVATRIIELENKTVTSYEGNYTYFMKVKTQRRAALQSAYEKQQEHIRKTEEYIRKYKAGIKSKQARGRQSQLNRLERIVLPPEDASFNYFALNTPPECAQRVAELEDVSMSFGAHEIFQHISLLIRNGDGVALVGPNGAGKTTLLRVLVGELESPTGRVKIGSRVKIGYFSQQHEGLHMENTVLDEIMYEYGIGEEQARKYLGAFLFHGDEVLRRIGDMSGGEQSRVAFLKLMLTGANFLVLDEPTNHLDIPAREAVEEALMAYPGTFLAVSHDRYFLDKVANCTLELENGSITEYMGNYSYYLMKKELAEAEAEEERLEAEKAAKIAEAREKEKQAKARKKAGLSTKPSAEEKAKAEAKQQAELGRIQSMSDAKRTEMIQRAEAEIAMAEAELKGLEYQMNDPAVQADPAKSQEIAEAYAAKEEEIEQRYEKWERLTEA